MTKAPIPHREVNMSLRLIIAISTLLGAASFAQTPTAPGEAQTPPAAARQIPWPTLLGLRSHQTARMFPLVDRVVLVPDGATYLDELGRWSAAGRWPVLFEDDQYAPMFIRAFQPEQVIRRDSVGELPETPKQQKDLMESVVIRVFGGDPTQDSLRETFDRARHIPAGVVIASPADPAWTAAVALAAGHGQPLAWLSGPSRKPHLALATGEAVELTRRVESLVAEQGYSYAGLGDQIDAITICRTMAGKAEIDRAAWTQAPAPPEFQDGPVAITDLLGRTRQRGRYAFVGWILGDEARSAYMAMCSLFLEAHNIHLYNTYPEKDFWLTYGVSEAASVMREKGFEVRTAGGENATERAWLRMLPRGLSTDVFVMNSKGHANDFDLYSGKGYPVDVPILNRPVALHLIHSWSMRNPVNRNTVGGRWLQRGAYALVASAHEPLLGAFIPPRVLAERWLAYVPFLVAARHWNGPYSGPWRISTFGDPLMLCNPPEPDAMQRLSWSSQDIPGGRDLGEQAKAAMRRIAEDGDREAFAEAAAALNLLGRDDLLIKLWTVAKQKDAQASVARPVLGALFRRGDADQFMLAWDQLPARDDEAVDMLWHLLLPRLGEGAKQDWLYQLQATIRQPLPHVDLKRLAPHLTRAFGWTHLRALIQRELDKTRNEHARKKLAEMLKKS
ncbi:MAG: hypothetical protein JSV91_11370 [Phycisphaerales bacterium]|nr:MAG: hypothetical protein JSV91_11370 [Phycisphaerales bacterium]